MDEYFRVSRTGTYGFLMALPLLLGYEILMLLSRSRLQVGSGVLIKRILEMSGLGGHLALLIAVFVLGMLVFFHERKKAIPFKPHYLGWMLAESLLIAPLFAVTVGWLTYQSVPQLASWPLAAGAAPAGLLVKIGLSLGAGVYEEFLFRVILVGGMFWLARALWPRHAGAIYVVVALIGALVFSIAHYLGGEHFQVASFLYRFIGGLLLNGLYLARGFGVAAWTHAFFDIMVMLHQG